MPPTFLELRGEPVAAEGLQLPRAQALARLLTASPPYPFVRLIESRKIPVDPESPGSGVYKEIVVFEMGIEVPQVPVHTIQRVERIAAQFYQDDEFIPEALALRADFPNDVLHLLMGGTGEPPSLCLSDRPWEEDRLRWTARRFVEQVRQWLALTAEGKLHQDDQPLEPLLFGREASIILPSDLFGSNRDLPERLYCHRTSGHESEKTIVVLAEREPSRDTGGPARFVAIPLGITPPVTHGIIRWQPMNLKLLHEFLAVTGFDLLGLLRESLRTWQGDQTLLALKPIFLVGIPKRRQDDEPAEELDTWAFLALGKTLGEVGQEIGVLQKHAGQYVPLVGGAGEDAPQGEDIPLALMRPYSQFSPDMARFSNGIFGAAGNETRIAAIGMGALGSQVFENEVRAGFGRWKLIDDDILMPHNLARHALHSTSVGEPKVVPLADLANALFREEDRAKAIVTNILKPKENAEELNMALHEADVVVDMSASVAVARHLARDRDDVVERRISAFLTPSGSDLVVLAEDAGRLARLDALEIQYYRAVAFRSDMSGHLQAVMGKRRYGHSCRDLSHVISQELIALHAATAGRAIRKAIAASSEPLIRIWRADENLGVTMVTVPVFPVVEIVTPGTGWKLCTDAYLLDKVRSLRAEKSPNETGGVLLGSVDTQRQIIYVADVLPSPPDSQEECSGYVRGSVGLQAEIVRVEEATAGWLEYIGEWHSHPPGYSAAYSRDDTVLFTWLGEQLAPEDHPPVMLIVGEDERWYVEHLPEKQG